MLNIECKCVLDLFKYEYRRVFENYVDIEIRQLFIRLLKRLS